MNETVKDKIVFAITLLATLFTIQPIVASSQPIGFDLLRFHITATHLYYVIGILLSASVYFYSVNFVTERAFIPVQRIGNVLYALAILAPPLFVALWGSVVGIDLAGKLLNAPQFQRVSESIVSCLLGVAVTILTQFFSAFLSRKDRTSKIQSITKAEADHFLRARQMLDVGHYDLAVLELFRAVDAALRRLLFEKQITAPLNSQRDLVQVALKNKILPETVAPETEQLRNMRNRAVHSKDPVSKDEAEIAFSLARRILGSLGNDEEYAP